MRIAGDRQTVLLGLPSGKGGISVLVGDFATNLESVARAIFTDTNMVVDATIEDRARARNHTILREGLIDSRMYMSAGRTTQVALWAAGPPVAVGVNPTWYILRPGKVEGIMLTQSSSMASLAPLFRGVELGPFASAVRADVGFYSMNVVLGALRAAGFNAENGRVSFVEPLLRVQCKILDGQDRGESPYSIVGGLTSQLVNPVTQRVWGNFFPGGPNQAAWVAADTVSRVVNIEDFMREAQGENRFAAGWGPGFWNKMGATGVAVVPIKTSGAMLAQQNSAWTLAHMEYPRKVRQVDTNVISINAALAAVGAEREYTNTSCTHVPGPYGKVLFVIVDQTTDRAVQVAVEGAVGVLLTTPALHYVIGGIDMGIGLMVTREVGLAIDQAALENIMAMERWVEFYGNEEDWQSATTIVGCAYVTFGVEMRRHTNRVEGGYYWQVGANPPFPLGGLANWTRLDNLTAAQQAAIYADIQNTVEAPWGGFRVRNPVPTAAPNAMYTRFEPVLAVGTVAMLWRPEHPMLAPLPDRPSALADICYQRGRMCAAQEDIVVGQLGFPEDMIRAPVGVGNVGLAQRLIRKMCNVNNQILEAKHASTVHVVLNGYWSIGAGVTYRAIYAQSGPGTMRKRIPWAEMRSLGFDADLVKNDLYGIGSGDFVAVNATIGALGGIWDVVRYPLPVPSKEARAAMNTTNCMGGWTRAVTRVDNLGTIREGGLEPEPLGIVMKTPTASRATYLRWSLFATPAIQSDTREYPFGGYSRSGTETNHHVLTALSGGRIVVLKDAEAEQNPVFLNRTSGQPTTNTPQVDSQGSTTEAFLDI
ncbi:structural protein [Piscine myocarditis-like virus]|uniref:Structural protein n=1 Tax=Piscine myocarditis-like virus TaxID=1798085 RepID=A0A125SJD1_9VIRU|nr:structural protein [Piscine myocarditis-like virus]AME30134.1 structural protein [Piscine myocarditis-like virus]